LRAGIVRTGTPAYRGSATLRSWRLGSVGRSRVQNLTVFGCAVLATGRPTICE